MGLGGFLKDAALTGATGGLYLPAMMGKKYFFDDPANEVKGAYDKAIGESQGNAQRLTDFYNQRRGQALGFYAPIQGMFDQAYGTGGIQAPQVPRAPGGPLQSMYGGR